MLAGAFMAFPLWGEDAAARTGRRVP